MPNITAKTSSNVFYKARCEAAKHNEQLSSREGAADIMSIPGGYFPVTPSLQAHLKSMSGNLLLSAPHNMALRPNFPGCPQG